MSSENEQTRQVVLAGIRRGEELIGSVLNVPSFVVDLIVTQQVRENEAMDELDSKTLEEIEDKHQNCIGILSQLEAQDISIEKLEPTQMRSVVKIVGAMKLDILRATGKFSEEEMKLKEFQLEVVDKGLDNIIQKRATAISSSKTDDT